MIDNNRIKDVLRNMFEEQHETEAKERECDCVLCAITRELNKIGDSMIDQNEINAAMIAITEKIEGNMMKLASLHSHVYCKMAENTKILAKAIYEIRISKLSLMAIDRLIEK